MYITYDFISYIIKEYIKKLFKRFMNLQVYEYI